MQAVGWRWTTWELMWVNGPILLSSGDTCLKYPLPNEPNACVKELATIPSDPKQSSDLLNVTGGGTVYETILRPWLLCFQEPICLVLNAHTALICVLLFAWLESFPMVFRGIYGFNQGEVGLAFLGLLCGATLATCIFFVWFRLIESKTFDSDCRLKPETRFIPLMAGCCLIPTGLFVFDWGANSHTHWIVPVVGSALFSIGGVSLFFSILNYLPDAYPDHAAFVLAGNSFLRCNFGAAFVLLAAPLYNRLGHAWASTLLGFLSCGVVPIPFLFYYLGDRIRKSSKHARKDV